MVVAIDSDRQIPHEASIYVGESAVFPIVFYPEDYESSISDYSCGTPGITLSLEENYNNILRINVGQSVASNTQFNIYFRNQIIIQGLTVAKIAFTGFKGFAANIEDVDRLQTTNVGSELYDGFSATTGYVRLLGDNLHLFNIDSLSCDSDDFGGFEYLSLADKHYIKMTVYKSYAFSKRVKFYYDDSLIFTNSL